MTTTNDLEWLEGLTLGNIQQVCQEYCAWSSASGEPHACSVEADRAERIFADLRAGQVGSEPDDSMPSFLVNNDGVNPPTITEIPNAGVVEQ